MLFLPRKTKLMRYIWLNTQSPHHNLAVEEYLLKHTHDDIFMLWQNADSIIIGRHQNTLAEINLDFVEQQHIIIARRLTGGGAVFHDLGNLNFTFIQNIQPEEKEINFVKYLQPIVDALNHLGVAATFSGRNDIVIDGKKISGNAMCFHENRVLEHGTLLFSTIQNNLAQALKVDPAKFSDKAVKSVRSRVTNISEHLQKPMTVLEFKDYLMNFVAGENRIESLTEQEEEIVRQLEQDKFSRWEWNFGNSPKYSFDKKIKTKGGILQVMMNVSDGRIANLMFFGDFFGRKDPDELAQQLIGTEHQTDILKSKLTNIKIEDYFNNVSVEELLELLK